LIKKTGRWLKYTLITLVILVGVMVAVLRFGLPLVSHYNEEVNAWLSDLVGIPIHLRQLQVSWYGTSPQLRLLDVQVLSDDRQQVLMGFKQIRVALDTLASLRAGSVQTGLIQIVGADIVIEQGPQGEIKVQGLPEQMKPRMGSSDSQWLDNLAEIAFLDSALTIKKGKFTFQYTDLDVILRNQGERHEIQGAALLADVARNRVAFAGEWRGPLLHPEKATGKMYFQADHFAIESLPMKTAYQGVQVERGHLDLTLWARWDKLVLERVTGTIGLQDFTLVGEASMLVKAFTSRFDWVQADDQRSLNFKDAEIQSNAQAQPIHLDFSLQQQVGASNGALLVNLKTLDLAQWGVWRQLFPDGKLAEVLARIAPTGILQDVRLHSPISDGPLHFSASGRVAGLSTHFWENRVPGLSAWDVDFVLTEAEGEVRFHSEHSAITFQRLFRAPLPMDLIDGHIAWYRQGSDWVVTGQDIHAKAADIDTLSDFSLRLPDRETSPFLDLQVAFKNGNAANTSRYLPTDIMSDSVIAWLDKAFVQGNIVQGSVLVRGQLADFPFKQGRKGRFEVHFTVEDLVLHYAKDWPLITHMAADVFFTEDKMTIVSKRGKIFRSNLHRVVVAIDHLSEGSPLRIKGQVKGALEDSLKFLQNSPLWASFKSWMTGVKGTGQHTLDLDATIALSAQGQHKIAGRLHFLDNTVTREGAELTKVKGVLSFTETAVKTNKLQATLLGMPLQIQIDRRPQTGVLVSVQGLFEAQQAAQAGLDPALFAGKTTWQAKITLPEQADEAQVVLHSDLKGLAVQLPEPFAKTQSSALKTTVRTTLGSEQAIARMRYGDRLNAIIQYAHRPTGIRLVRGSVRFGTDKAVLSADSGLSVSGQVPMLSWVKWRDWWLSAAAPSSARVSGVELRALDLVIQRFEVNEGEYKNIALTLNRFEQEWLGTIKCRGVEGAFAVPIQLDEKKPIVVHLKHFHFWRPATTEPAPSTQKRQEAPDPWTIPPIQMMVDKFVYEDQNLGVLSFNTRPKGLGIQLQALRLKSKYIDFSANGLWEKDEQGQENTEFELAFKTRKLGKTISLLGFPGVMKGGKAEAVARFSWPDSLINFSLITLEGSAALRVEKGQFLDIEPGVGRAFGLLSLGTIQRRLSLDFSDLFEKGFAFDLLWGGFELNEGEVVSRNLYLDGPAALVEVIGGTDLVHERYDQIVVVTPKVSGNAPLAGAALGGPLVGASIWVVQKVVGGVIDKSVQKIYAVDGPWDQPVVTDTREGGERGLLKKLKSLLPVFGGSNSVQSGEGDGEGEDF